MRTGQRHIIDGRQGAVGREVGGQTQWEVGRNNIINGDSAVGKDLNASSLNFMQISSKDFLCVTIDR